MILPNAYVCDTLAIPQHNAEINQTTQLLERADYADKKSHLRRYPKTSHTWQIQAFNISPDTKYWRTQHPYLSPCQPCTMQNNIQLPLPLSFQSVQRAPNFDSLPHCQYVMFVRTRIDTHGPPSKLHHNLHHRCTSPFFQSAIACIHSSITIFMMSTIVDEKAIENPTDTEKSVSSAFSKENPTTHRYREQCKF